MRKALAKMAICLALTACKQVDFCDHHWEHAPSLDYCANMQWKLDWLYGNKDGNDWAADWNQDRWGLAYDDLRPSTPEGVRVLNYSIGSANTIGYVGADGGKIYMIEGENELLFVNSDTEYILFDDLYSCATARATTRALTRSTFIAANSPVEIPGSENTVSAPDALFGHYIPCFQAERKDVTQYFDVEMKPLTVAYLIVCRFDHGLEYAGLARGVLSGVAASVYLTDGHTGEEAASVLYDCEIKDGYVSAVVNTFGAPGYPNEEYSRGDRPYALNLELKLKNGHSKIFDFDISDQMRNQPRGGVIEISGLEITDSEGMADSGGFCIDVEGWGEAIDVPIM